MWYWLFFGVLQVTAGYTSTFGAGTPERTGRIASVRRCGRGFTSRSSSDSSRGGSALTIPHRDRPAPAGDTELEAIYLKCLAFAALPMLVMAAVNGFFSGRGQTWTVLLIEGVGTAVNIALALLLIFGRGGFPEMGIEGAGWATVAGSYAAALFALALMLRNKYRAEFDTLGGWKLERELFGRLMKFGGPAGMQVFLDVLVFNAFTQLVGQLGEAALGATTLTVRLNMIAFLPMMGLGQAICILVGQRLGENRPELAEKSAYTGLKWSFGYMCLVAFVYVAIPGVLVAIFEGDKDPEKYAAIAKIVPGLLLCVAVFSIADAINLSFAFALRGAGDTKYVTMRRSPGVAIDGDPTR